MALKGLRNFQKFDTKGYFENKRLVYTGLEEWKEDKKVVGSKVRCIIMQDNTDYGNSEFNAKNLGQTITIKTRQAYTDLAGSGAVPFQTVVFLGEMEKVSVYGDFMTELSLTGNVKLVQPK